MADEKRDQNIDREALAAKLDKDLDDHIQNVIEKNKDYKYESELTMENLDEQLRQIPAFCNDVITQEDIDASPSLQALQAIKYEEDNPDACALSHKEDGNYHFQKKDYRKAVKAYTEGLKQKHDDSNLIAVLYTNRAAAHSHLGNNRSALNDATSALKHKPDHMKAIIRATTTCFDLEQYEECIKWCDTGLEIDGKERKLIDYKKKAALQKKQKDRDIRKKEMKQFKDLKHRNDLISALTARSIKVFGDEDETDEYKIERLLFDRSPRMGKIYLDENKHLHWPLHLLYPEYNQTDFIEDINELDKISDHMKIVFADYPAWDEAKAYSIKNLELFFEYRKKGQMIRIDPKITVATLLSDSRYVLSGECPVLMVLSNKTDFYAKTFENQDYEDF